MAFPGPKVPHRTSRSQALAMGTRADGWGDTLAGILVEPGEAPVPESLRPVARPAEPAPFRITG